MTLSYLLALGASLLWIGFWFAVFLGAICLGTRLVCYCSTLWEKG